MNTKPDKTNPPTKSFLATAFSLAKDFFTSYERSVVRIYEMTKDLPPADQTRIMGEIFSSARRYY